MAHTITIGRNTNPKRTRLGGSHEFGISGRTGPSLRNAQEHTAITVVENVPGSRWNRLNNALPSAFRPGRKHGHTARRRIGGTHRESKHGHETPHAEHKRLRRHSVMLSSQPAWRLFARVLWNKSLPRRGKREPGKKQKKWVSRGVTPDGNPVRTNKKRGSSGNPATGLDRRILQRKNAAACYSPTPSRVQYHRRDQALASGFGKGPGVSPGP